MGGDGLSGFEVPELFDYCVTLGNFEGSLHVPVSTGECKNMSLFSPHCCVTAVD